MAHEKLRLAGLVTGLVLIGSQMLGGLMFLVPLGIGWAAREVPLIAYLNLLGPLLIVLCGLAFAWRKPFIGGTVLIAAWLLWMVLSHVLSLDTIRRIFEAGVGLTSWIAPMVFRLLLLASGVLFVLSGRRTQAVTEEAVPKTLTSGRCQKLHLAGMIVGLMVGMIYIQRGVAPELIGILTFVGAGLVIFGSVALAWRRPLVGGIVLIVESLWPLVILAAFPLFPSSEALGMAMLWGMMPQIVLFLCFPLLLSGILFILSWREGGKHTVSMSKPE